MCGRFAQYISLDEYFDAMGLKPDQITFDTEPIGRYNVAPGTRVLLLNGQHDALRLDTVLWGYGPEWWDKQPLINARGETAAGSCTDMTTEKKGCDCDVRQQQGHG
ncbi:SOS response-associated peptidase family protein [Pantoea sp. ME81]|uniref:SOS response-associated peptidase family protein n=1 Tax=Pantoea sp. ME81 TaxID=2743935 RepID=UPI002102FE65|nr:SOS response-associated peptidase family protein [Pantoea sp. ME81]